MVDTINPNTNQPDSTPLSNIPPSSGPAPMPDGHFYGGFDRPDEVKINLAADAPTGNTSPGPQITTPPPVTPVTPPPVYQPTPQPTTHDVTPNPALAPQETVKHDSYAAISEPVNLRGLLVIIGLGLLLIAIAGASTYYAVGYMNTNTLNKKRAELDTANKNLQTLQLAPTPLQSESAKNAENNVTTQTPVVTTPPVTTPTVTQPVETPAPTVPATKTDGGRDGTG